MKRTFLFLSLLYSFQVNPAFSQNVPVSSFTTDWEIAAARRSNITLDYASIEGSPYYYQNFVNSIVTLVDGSIINAPLRYDIFQDEIEYIKNDISLWINKNDIRTIQYGSDMLCVAPLNDDTSKLYYFFMQNTGKYSLYVRKTVAYSPYIPAKAYADPIPAKFISKGDDYYLRVEGEPLRQFTSKKALSAMFSDNKQTLDFIKNEKISHDNMKDLTKLVAFLNKL